MAGSRREVLRWPSSIRRRWADVADTVVGGSPRVSRSSFRGNPLLHWLGSVIARKAHNVGERRFTVDEHPALPLPDGPVPDGRNTFSHLIRMDPLSTIVTISIDVFSATVATAVGIAWASRAQDSIPPIWLSAFYVPVVIGLLATRQAYRRRGH